MKAQSLVYYNKYVPLIHEQALIAKFNALSVSPTEFADAHQLPRTVVHKMLNLKHPSNPTLKTIDRFAEALGCDPFELVSE